MKSGEVKKIDTNHRFFKNILENQIDRDLYHTETLNEKQGDKVKKQKKPDIVVYEPPHRKKNSVTEPHAAQSTTTRETLNQSTNDGAIKDVRRNKKSPAKENDKVPINGIKGNDRNRYNRVRAKNGNLRKNSADIHKDQVTEYAKHKPVSENWNRTIGKNGSGHERKYTACNKSERQVTNRHDFTSHEQNFPYRSVKNQNNIDNFYSKHVNRGKDVVLDEKCRPKHGHRGPYHGNSRQNSVNRTKNLDFRTAQCANQEVSCKDNPEDMWDDESCVKQKGNRANMKKQKDVCQENAFVDIGCQNSVNESHGENIGSSPSSTRKCHLKCEDYDAKHRHIQVTPPDFDKCSELGEILHANCIVLEVLNFQPKESGSTNDDKSGECHKQNAEIENWAITMDDDSTLTKNCENQTATDDYHSEYLNGFSTEKGRSLKHDNCKIDRPTNEENKYAVSENVCNELIDYCIDEHGKLKDKNLDLICKNDEYFSEDNKERGDRELNHKNYNYELGNDSFAEKQEGNGQNQKLVLENVSRTAECFSEREDQNGIQRTMEMNGCKVSSFQRSGEFESVVFYLNSESEDEKEDNEIEKEPKEKAEICEAACIYTDIVFKLEYIDQFNHLHELMIDRNKDILMTIEDFADSIGLELCLIDPLYHLVLNEYQSATS